MKKVLISLGFAALALGATAQVKIKDGTVTGSSTTPNSNAILELESNQRGLLYPRVALQATNLSAPLPQHIKGMMVYDTVSAGDAPYTVTPGIYYNDGTQWVRASGKSDWLIFGNANSAVNGTPAGSTDSQYVTGRVAIGTNTAAAVASATSGSTAAQQTAYLTVAGGDANINGVTVGAGGGSNNVNSVAVGNQALYNNTNGTNNTAIGTGSLTANTTGFSNTAVGYQALTANQQGLQNTAVGGLALQQNVGSPSSTSIGSRNTAVGFNALNANTTGKNNTGIGYYTLSNITVDSNNIALGWAAGSLQTAGSNNIVIGYFEQLPNSTGSNQLNIGGSIFGVNMLGTAASAPTGNIMINATTPATVASAASGSTAAQQLATFTVAGGDAAINTLTVGRGGGQDANSVAVGNQALYENTNGKNNTAIGTGSLAANTTGIQNTGVGFQTFYNNTTGTQAVAIGHQALNGNTTGNYNVAVGQNALFTNTAGSGNTGVGINALSVLTGANPDGNTNSHNTALGMDAGFTQTAGNNNIVIGAYQQLEDITGSYQMNIGGAIFGTNMDGNAPSSGGAGGQIGIGMVPTGTAATLYVSGQVSATNVALTSDARYKQDVQPVTNVLDKVLQLRSVTYNWNRPYGTAHGMPKLDSLNHIGFLAQEVEKIFPQVVHTDTDKNKTKSISYTELIPVLTEAIQEQQKEIEQLKKEIEALKK